MLKRKDHKNSKPAIKYVPILFVFVFVFMHIAACASDKESELYAQYQLLCSIIDTEYTDFQSSDKSVTAKMELMQAIEKKVGTKISSDQVKQTYLMLVSIGGENPYELLKSDVKSRTGKDFSCDAFKALTQLNIQ